MRHEHEEFAQCVRCGVETYPDFLDADKMCEPCAREYEEELNG